jgi:type IV pilus assembly protein PilB
MNGNKPAERLSDHKRFHGFQLDMPYIDLSQIAVDPKLISLTKSTHQYYYDDSGVHTDTRESEEAPVIRIVNSLICEAISQQASDIHIEPCKNVLRVRYRIDGILHDTAHLPLAIQTAIIARIKVISGMDITEKRLPQDGRILWQESEKEVNLRTSTLPTIYGEKAVIRILDRSRLTFDIHSLGFSKENIKQFLQILNCAYGLILLTGPAGSGKTTTLYSALTALNSSGRNLVTIEDPVEFSLEGINQVQVNSKTGLTFAGSLRSILRQDPNIIMVGEIRDSETADIAVRAALTGHLVLSTLHTDNAVGAVIRLREMGIEPFLISSVLLGVVAQRLVRRICHHCKYDYSLPLQAPERRLLEPDLSNRPAISVYEGKGCSHCHFTGYHGRTAIHEVLLMNSTIRELLSQKVSARELSSAFLRQGLHSLVQDGVDKALLGDTTLSEVMRVAYSCE